MPRLLAAMLASSLASIGCDAADTALDADSEPGTGTAAAESTDGAADESTDASPLEPQPADSSLTPNGEWADDAPPFQPLCATMPTPTAEWAWKFNQKGYLDTSIAISSFFNGPHTVMAWVMPEFTYNGSGPILAENGGGVYVVGQGNYRDGDADVGKLVPGDPVLHVSIGGQWRNYLVPGYKKREWNHVALVRTAPDANGNFKFKLYVNGLLQTPMEIVMIDDERTPQPVSEITFGPTMPMDPTKIPQGELRLGRRTDGLGTLSSESWQFYGLIDEVAVFNQAMESTDIVGYYLCGFSGNESTMLAGLTFDQYHASDPAGAKIVQPITPVAPTSSFVRRTGVAPGYKHMNATDTAALDAMLHLAPTQVSYQLPFPAGEEWQVTQGIDDRGGTHNGFAAFCWDFSKVGSPAGAVVTAAAAGDIYFLRDSQVPVGTEQEGNKILIKTADEENLMYLHQEPNSFLDVFLDGDPLLFLPQTGPAFWIAVAKGAALARTGTNAGHLHLDAHDDRDQTFPIAFSNYQVKDTSVSPPVWISVLRGQPKFGQIIRRN